MVKQIRSEGVDAATSPEYPVPELFVGATVWLFDGDHRIYDRDPVTGRARGGPIFREHFRPVKIVGETSVSWIAGGGGKIPKNPAKRSCGGHEQRPDRHGPFFLTEEAVDDAVWNRSNRYRIKDALDRATVAQLRAIAALLAFEPEGK